MDTQERLAALKQRLRDVEDLGGARSVLDAG